MARLRLAWLKFREFVSWCERRSHRVFIRSVLGALFLVWGFWSEDDFARRTLLSLGAGLITISWGKHQQDQGQRRKDPSTGKELRNPTLRISREEVERILSARK